MRIILFVLFYGLAIVHATAQTSTDAVTNCDTFTIKGKVIYLARYSKKIKKQEVYYGFIPTSVLQKDIALNSLLQKYSEYSLSRDIGTLINVSKKNFFKIKRKISDAFLREASTSSINSSLCDTTKYYYILDCLYPDTVGNKRRELPNAQSYSPSRKIEVNPLKPMICVRQMGLRCFEITFPSFKAYCDLELDPARFSHPLSIGGRCIECEIDLKEIKKARKKDGKYHLLVPIYRVD